MKEQGTKRKRGPKDLEKTTRRRGGVEEYKISLAFMPNAGD